MLIKNTTKKKIIERSFEGGYVISVLPGVSMIFDKAGEFLVGKYVPQGEHGKWKGKDFIEQPAPVPAIVVGEKKEWEATGKKFAQVERFQIQPNLIPKVKLLEIAEERGVKNQVKSSMSEEEIIEVLNTQPVPDEIAYPEEETKNEE